MNNLGDSNNDSYIKGELHQLNVRSIIKLDLNYSNYN